MKLTSLNYTIIVMGPVYGTQSSYCAYQFCKALMQSPHQIKSLFFYADGIYNANQFVSPANDEFNLVKAWQTLSQDHQIELNVCISAALRRGVMMDDGNHNLAPHFQLVGLGALSEAIADSDRLIQF